MTKLKIVFGPLEKKFADRWHIEWFLLCVHISELLPAHFPLEVVTFVQERRAGRKTCILYHSVQSSFFNLCVFIFKVSGTLGGKILEHSL